MKNLWCVIADSKLESPGVGLFLDNASTGLLPARAQCIGTLFRLGEYIQLLAPDHIHIRRVISSGTHLMAGDVIAEIVTAEAPSLREQTSLTLSAPADGFIAFSDAAGRPIKNPGDMIHPGDIIAFLEFMKIRMEIVYSGNADVVFDHYCGPDHRAVRSGEIIAEFI